MKKIYYLLIMALVVVGFTSCDADEGAKPGSNSNPTAVIYQYEAEVTRPDDADGSVRLRFAVNNRTEALYYLAEKAADKKAKLASMGEAGYNDYVVENGVKVDGIASAGQPQSVDVTIKDLVGEYAITAVAVAGKKKTAYNATFTGLEWEDVATGTYTFNKSIGLPAVKTTLQLCKSDKTLYRFKELFGAGYSLKIKLMSLTGQDSDGEYTFFRVPKLVTPLTFGNYGTVTVWDVGYWQGKDAWITDNGYESGMYADNSCFILMAYTVNSGGKILAITYKNYDFFNPE